MFIPECGAEDESLVGRKIDGGTAVFEQGDDRGIVQEDSPISGSAVICFAAAQNDGLITGFPDAEADPVARPGQLAKGECRPCQ